VLENARFEAAQSAFGKLRAAFFDWNEIRVSTVKELAEVMPELAEPSEAAARVKGILQSVFESDYSFDLEHLKKQNLGAAAKRLQKLQGATPFVVAYATQMSLGGHSIPVDKGTLGALYVLGVINESEAAAGNVPGMERAIPKSKGTEFGGLLHELGADFFANPFSTTLREQLLAIAPDAKDRFPKRAPKKPVVEPEPAPAPVETKKKEAGKPIAKPVAKGVKEPVKEAAKKGKEKIEKRAPAKAAAAPKKKPAKIVKKTPSKVLAKRKPR
jgi:endonuclease-3